MKRFENEDFDDYKERRAEANKELKQKLEGKVVWFSKNIRTSSARFNRGTYVRAEHGQLS